jgi:hypothetical protein
MLPSQSVPGWIWVQSSSVEQGAEQIPCGTSGPETQLNSELAPPQFASETQALPMFVSVVGVEVRPPEPPCAPLAPPVAVVLEPPDPEAGAPPVPVFPPMSCPFPLFEDSSLPQLAPSRLMPPVTRHKVIQARAFLMKVSCGDGLPRARRAAPRFDSI